jgi:hypothetical protein
MDLVEIEKLTREFSKQRKALAERMDEMRSEVSTAYKKHLSGVREATERVGEAYKLLFEAVREAPELFQKPRTVYFSGIRVGYIKGKDRLEWLDNEQLAKGIEKEFPDLYPGLVKVVRTPIEKALMALDGDALKRLGVTLDPGRDEILIKAREDDIDKLVAAFINKVEQELPVEE